MALTPPLEHLSFLTLFNALTEALLLVDESGRIIMANTALHRMLGYDEGGINGLFINTLIPRFNPTQHLIDTALPDDKSKPDKITALSQDGRELHASACIKKLATNDKPLLLITIDRRSHAEELLRLTQERFDLAKRAGGLGVYDRDLTSNQLFWDDRSRELWGLDADEEITYDKFEDCIHPEDRHSRSKELRHALDPRSNGEYHTEFRIKRKNDGAECWIASSGKISFVAGKPVRLVGFMRDITEHKLIESQSHKRRDETESLLKQQIAIQTASAIAHEINQPLTAISAYSEVALHSMNSNNTNSESLRRALEGCVVQAQRAGDSLHELLNFLRQNEMAAEPTDINRLVKTCIDIAKRDGYGGFNPELDLEKGIPSVMCNPLQIQKVILNLVRNAIEAIRSTDITAKISIKASTHAEKNMAQITVQDNGPGFDQDAVRHIFEPFFTTKPNGIGMGLAISRSLVEANGGKLWHEQHADTGATIHFTLPFVR